MRAPRRGRGRNSRSNCLYFYKWMCLNWIAAHPCLNTWRPAQGLFPRTPFLGSLGDCGWEGRFSFRIRLKRWIGLFLTAIGTYLATRQNLFPCTPFGRLSSACYLGQHFAPGVGAGLVLALVDLRERLRAPTRVAPSAHHGSAALHYSALCLRCLGRGLGWPQSSMSRA